MKKIIQFKIKYFHHFFANIILKKFNNTKKPLPYFLDYTDPTKIRCEFYFRVTSRKKFLYLNNIFNLFF